MTAQHTPGPWQVIGEDDLPGHDDLAIVAFDVSAPGEDAPSIFICNVGSDGGRYGAFAPVEAGEEWPVSLANARLIASAPELLAERDRLRAELMALRRWRTEQDCRYTLGNVADIDGSHCPSDKPCERCQSEREIDRLRARVGGLRAYIDSQPYQSDLDGMRMRAEAAEAERDRLREYVGRLEAALVEYAVAWDSYQDSMRPRKVSDGPFRVSYEDTIAKQAAAEQALEEVRALGRQIAGREP